MIESNICYTIYIDIFSLFKNNDNGSWDLLTAFNIGFWNGSYKKSSKRFGGIK